jgi:hypothetical protein
LVIRGGLAFDVSWSNHHSGVPGSIHVSYQGFSREFDHPQA